MRFRGRRRRAPIYLIAVVAVLGFLVFFEGYRFVMPFVSKNPMYHDVTIGENVIDHWRYGGFNPEGYLRFHDTATGQTITLPPTEKLFGADGKFVVIERADPGSITYASPLESAPPIWYALMALMVAAALWLTMLRLRLKRRHQMHLRKSATSKSSSGFHINHSRKFRPTKFRRFR